ncbi:UDP-N-acetylglucosamine--undecaprenyl-phosphate N-acetylglucosaminephosphotransferase [Vibrio mexicanus]|uniref:UDP-N-acetylglucosamine--undecaprenyl-phosphate N-acetylglucosaminephosphotransferase n=1 Tax=Vibrio mexicanus TaxID=1004326 RepID=UPI00063C5C83|nr:UDP-N-acetylglucosamine--undecaprenyl-phosphate N-acetylglucosaminephosphotransferase [Vibrio mexicanus]
MQTFFLALLAMVVSTMSLLWLRKWAVDFKFVDVPCERKSHNGHIPLVGGLATFLGLCVVILFSSGPLLYKLEYLCFSAILVVVGLVDDKLDIRASYRLLILSFLSIWLVKIEGISLSYLGNLLGNGSIALGGEALIFTTAAIIGCVTAFNMVDGIDGLLGVLAACTIGSLGILFYSSGCIELARFCLFFIAAMLPYVVVNLGLKVKSKYKVFMGDSGSFLVGFTIVWLLVFATQQFDGLPNGQVAMRPVTALWIIAIPLMDMATVMIKRAMKKRSPLKADRTHIHHVLIASGLTAKQALASISVLAMTLAGVGIVGEFTQEDESFMFAAFMQMFVVYLLVNIAIERKARKRAPELI